MLGLLARLERRRTEASLLDRVLLSPGEGTSSPAEVTVDAAIQSGHLRVLPGTAITDEVPITSAGVRVIDARTVHDRSAPRRGLDALELEASWPRARRTEPGDVIFCASPRPAAIVDHDGLSAVAAPARILRCAPGSGVVPEAVAGAINALPERSPRWRAWRVPLVPVGEAEVLRTALRHLADQEDQARQRLSELRELAHELTHGVARGAMTLRPTEEGH